MRRTLIVRTAAGAAVAGALLAVALWPDTIDVDAAAAQQSAMQVTIDEEGETRVRERFVVTAPVAGQLRRIEIEPGEAVRRGQPILFLTPPRSPLLDARTEAELQTQSAAAEEAVGQMRADRDRARAMLERATTTERRLSNLVEIGGVSREDFDAARVARLSAETAVRAAEHALVRAERERDAIRARLLTPRSGGGGVVAVRSPADGVVLKRLRESEATVGAGDALIEVGNPRDIEIVADLLSTDAVRVRPGAPVSIERWGGEPIPGHVRRIEPSGFTKVSALGVEEQRVNVIVAIDEPGACASLGDGYRVDVRVTVWQAADALTVPIAALFRTGNEWSVFVVEGGRAAQRQVQVGERNDAVAQVLGGISAGQTVVLHPPDMLADGVRIRVRP